MTRVILVIDMLRGFLEQDYSLYCGARARSIIPNVQRLLERETKAGAKILYLCDHHKPDDPEFKQFPPHCIEGTAEAELISELSLYPGDIIPKRHYIAFYGTTLEQKLKQINPEVIVVCGVCTDICVL